MMHDRESRGPSGEMELLWIHSESGNEHWDEYVTDTLKADGDQVVLIKSTRTTNAIHSSDNTESERYAIPVCDLIDLIKTNGKKL